MKTIGKYLLADNRRACIIALLFTLLFWPGNFVAGVIVGFVTIEKGYKTGLAVLAWIAIPVIVMLFMRQFSINIYDVLLLRSVIIWVFAIQLRHFRNWLRVLQAATLIGIVFIIGIHIFVPDVNQYWIDIGNKLMSSNKLPDEIRATLFYNLGHFIRDTASIMTGVITVIALCGTILQVLIARWWQLLITQPGSFRNEFKQIHVGYIEAILLIVISIGLIWHPTWLVDMYPVLMIPFVFSGFSLVHVFIWKTKIQTFLFVVLYILLVMWALIMLLLLAMLGFIDSLYNFRARYLRLLRN